MIHKKILLLIMIACLCFTLTLACSGNSPNVVGNQEDTEKESNGSGNQNVDIDPGADKGLFGSARFGASCFGGC